MKRKLYLEVRYLTQSTSQYTNRDGWLDDIREETSWNNDRADLAWFVCVYVSQLNSFSMRTGEVEGYRYCVALRIVSLPLYHTPSRSYPQTESGGPGLFHSWLLQRNGACGPLLLLIRADAWLSCMPAAQPNRDYVPGWWRQKKKVVEIFVFYTFGEFRLINYLCIISNEILICSKDGNPMLQWL